MAAIPSVETFRWSDPLLFDELLTDEERMIRDATRDYAQSQLMPRILEANRHEIFDRAILHEMGALGLLGSTISGYGCAGTNYVAYGLIAREIERVDSGYRSALSVQSSLVMFPIFTYGSEEQRSRFLPRLATGELVGCFGLTEPDHGSDPGSMTSRASKVDGGYRLNGAKNWITNGPVADYILVFAVTDRSGAKVKHTAFVVPRGTPGFTANAPDHKLGIHAAHSCTVFFENCRVPDSAVVGNVGEGFKVAMATLDGGRIGIACQALGIARAAFHVSVAYAKERKSFGVPIAQHQAIQFMLADMATELEAARLLTWRAATMKDEHVRHSSESSQAKLYASELATRVAHKAIQIHGGYGYSTEFPVERHYRDARITEIYEGTSEIQRIVIAAGLLKG